ncbi:SCAN domain-containing protein 3 [Trichonephila clavata]|uniref:SCAN domain-containing protein 3 n=1 Tax=Trichonephila clavata TaxID=2740835 RepID=A0A8X6HZA2_TRICU|nr:SCAN domain-containing protein 3 [Trichonephila clavata]
MRPLNWQGMDPRPFVNKPGESSMSVQKDQLLGIANDSHKVKFESNFCWIKVMVVYPEIDSTALISLFSCSFSAVTATKTKQWNKLDTSNTIRLSLSPITPRWYYLVEKKQV